MFCHRGSDFFSTCFVCVCVWGGGSGSVPLLPRKKITSPLLLIYDSLYNKKSQGSLRRLSFFKVLLVVYSVT